MLFCPIFIVICIFLQVQTTRGKKFFVLNSVILNYIPLLRKHTREAPFSFKMYPGINVVVIKDILFGVFGWL
jgi:hypothetical protein